MPLPFDVEAIRARFPALSRRIDGRRIAFLDGPAGTQVPRECIDSTSSYLETSNANTQGVFATSLETQALIAEARAAAADFIGAGGPGEIVFGPNMTTLTFAASRSFGRLL